MLGGSSPRVSAFSALGTLVVRGDLALRPREVGRPAFRPGDPPEDRGWCVQFVDVCLDL
jgi:hypothetical protein